MMSTPCIEPILHVPSIEENAAWYERVLGWQYQYDVCDDQGRCLFGGVFLKLEEIQQRYQESDRGNQS